MKVLFVCGGNTCRSPMAAALARSVHGIEADSAGIAPRTSATRDAIAVVLAPSAKAPCPSEGPILGEAATSRPALRSDLTRWQCELQAGQIRDTLLQGIVKKAVDSFEVIVRRSAATMRPLAEEGSAIPAKPFELLTLGQLVQY